MPKTTVSDTELFDGIEGMLGDVNISFERNHLGSTWKVSVKAQFENKGGGYSQLWTGGGDLRSALISVITQAMTERLTK